MKKALLTGFEPFHKASSNPSQKIVSGFIHVPLMDSQLVEFPDMPTMPLNQMVDAVKIIVYILQ